MNFEKIVLENFLFNEEYAKKILAFIKESYFTEQSEKIIFKNIQDYIIKYNERPSVDALHILLNDTPKLSEAVYGESLKLVETLNNNTENELAWLVDKTEEWAKEKSIHNAIMESINILDSKTDKDKGIIPELLSDALAVSLDTHIGHDYIEDYEERFEFYHREETRVPFNLKYLNDITNGGIPNKSLTVFLAGTGGYKTLTKCHLAASWLESGYNVLYITLEMAEEKIAERIDANLLNTPLNDLKTMDEIYYNRAMKKLKQKKIGKLIIKEYPTATASAGHFRFLLRELKLKKSFKPDVIIIDYLNICASSRLKSSAILQSYNYVKAIAEELRGIAVEFNVPIITSSQLNREGFTNSDPGLENTSESFGLPATADLMLAIISSEELDNLDQIMIKQLKNRFGDDNKLKKFVIGIDKPKMRLYDVSTSAQVSTNVTGYDDTHKIKEFNNGYESKKFEGFDVS
jgi:replicative DNA helicase|tara:strand:+ start:812 stop:2197 length:1386 start_codon:yes stop_codon:yes gene_type:complete